MDPERAAEDDDHHLWVDGGKPRRRRLGTAVDDLAEVVAVDTVREDLLEQKPNGVVEDDARVLGIGEQRNAVDRPRRGRGTTCRDRSVPLAVLLEASTSVATGGDRAAVHGPRCRLSVGA